MWEIYGNNSEGLLESKWGCGGVEFWVILDNMGWIRWVEDSDLVGLGLGERGCWGRNRM